MNGQYSPTGFSFLPVVVKNLLIINGILFLADLALARFGVDLNSILGLHFFMASDFKPFQLLTYMFMHGNFSHLFFNMFALWMFGNTLENIWGPKRFLLYFVRIRSGFASRRCAIYRIHHQTVAISDGEHGQWNHSHGSIPEPHDHCWCFGSHLWFVARLWHDVP